MPESYLQQVLKLVANEFDEQFWELASNRTHEQAYRELGKRYQQVFGRRRYNSYESFR